MGEKQNKIKILVTGGSGFIGSALVIRLGNMGYRVSSLSRNPGPNSESTGIKNIKCDLLDLRSLISACMEVDIVFHVAAKVGTTGTYKDFHKTNILGTKNLIHACREANVRSLIFTSSASVVFAGKDLEGVNEDIAYPRKALSHYTATKAMAEQMVLEANSDSLHTISLRPHIVWGPGDTHIVPEIIARNLAGKLRLIKRKNPLVDSSYIENVIDAHICGMNALDITKESWGKSFFITDNKPIPVKELFNLFIRASGNIPSYKTSPKWLAIALARIGELYNSINRTVDKPIISRLIIHEVSQAHWFDISSAMRILNYTPKISQAEGEVMLSEWLKSTCK